MPPQLTEAWGIAYLQILIVLLIFFFGIPSIVFQVTLPEEMRRIVNKYMKPYLRMIGEVALLITLFALYFVWGLHPCIIGVPIWKDWVGSIIITLSLIFLIVFWWIYLLKLSRTGIVNYLEVKIYKRFGEEGSKKHEELTDLITLGERSEAGHEKEIVLEAMSRLIIKLQKREGYKGGGLEYILRDFDEIVTSKDKPGNESDFQLSVGILEDIINRLSSQNFPGVSDEIFVYWSLKKIGKKAVELNLSKQVVLRVITIASSNPDVLFEIGYSAFNSGDYFSALAALSKLESLALPGKQKKPKVNDQLFGLMAHFWKGGGSARRRVESFLETYGDQFPDIDQILGQAVDAHYKDARYDTADKLMEMRANLAKSKTKGKKS
ncbi:MAG: hypothetical protein KAT34_18260 [Candidatus Aminicenantes bacterium]|nr:hypothetical protein [Candidatus Aminicenantes bacterium]